MLRDTSDLTAEPFAVSTALAAGIAPERLRRDEFDTPFHGIRVPAGSVKGIVDRCRALRPALADDVVFSHVTALQLHGVDVPWVLREQAADGAPLHVVTRSEADRPQRADVVAHRCRQDVLRTGLLDGLPVTTPAQTFVQVATMLRSPDQVVALGEAMMRHRRELTTPAALREVAERTRKVKGIVQVRAQVLRMRPGTDSVPETLTRLRLTGAGLPAPLVNATVRTAEGAYVKRCDLLYEEARVVIEYDGDHHRTDQAQWRDDVRRRRRLEELGYVVVVVVGDDLATRPPSGGLDFVARVRALLHRPAVGISPGAGTVVVPYRPGTPLWV